MQASWGLGRLSVVEPPAIEAAAAEAVRSLMQPGCLVGLRDGVLAGVRVRLLTDCARTHELFSLNFFQPDEWTQFSGVDREPPVRVFAYRAVDHPQLALVSPAAGVAVCRNAPYRTVHAAVWTACSDRLARHRGIFVVPGSAAEVCDLGVLLFGEGNAEAAVEVGRHGRILSCDVSTVRFSFGLGDDLVFVEAVQSPDDRTLRGLQALRWLGERGARSLGTMVVGETPSGEPAAVPITEVDPSSLAAHLWAGERHLYLSVGSGLLAQTPDRPVLVPADDADADHASGSGVVCWPVGAASAVPGQGQAPVGSCCILEDGTEEPRAVEPEAFIRRLRGVQPDIDATLATYLAQSVRRLEIWPTSRDPAAIQQRLAPLAGPRTPR